MFKGTDFTPYVDFITKSSTSQSKILQKHHILPKALWPQYKSLRIYPWNCALLSPGNHALAHIIFYEIVSTHENFQAIKKLRKYIDSDDVLEKYEKIAADSKKCLEQQRISGKNKLYKDIDGNHINDNMLGVVDLSLNVSRISCDEYNKFKELNRNVPKSDWKIVAVLSPEGQERLKSAPYTSPTKNKISVVSKTGDTKSMPSDEYKLQKMLDYTQQEWVPVISAEGLRRIGKEAKHTHIGKVCVFDTVSQTKIFVSSTEYSALKNIRYFLWQNYKKSIA